MFQMMTLDAAQAEGLLQNAEDEAAATRRSAIDVLCCQSLVHNRDGRAPVSDLLAGRLGLRCSCFVRARHHAEQGGSSRGLALFTASGLWVLNSGSFSVGAPGQEATVQFALIRKRSASVLVLNLHLAAAAPIRKVQLSSLFTSSLLRESYGAVVLCADRAAALYAKEWQALTAPSRYCPCHVQEDAAGGMLCLLKTRCAPMATVTVSLDSPWQLPGTALAFEVERVSPEKISRPTFPLSFREQWLGYREHRAFA
jgi:hypothetical protein